MTVKINENGNVYKFVFANCNVKWEWVCQLGLDEIDEIIKKESENFKEKKCMNERMYELI